MGGRRVTRNAVLWWFAVLLTLSSATWQRLSGPTYPVRGSVQVGEEKIRVRLTRTAQGEVDQPVRVRVADPIIEGEVAWRRFPTAEPWRTFPLQRDGEWLVGALPNQPPAGKLEYQVRLTDGAAEAVFPTRPAVTRFKGEVPKTLLFPHILAMFCGMLLSNRAGLAGLAGDRRTRRFAVLAALLIGAGGLVMGPIIQKLAFGAYWTGFPFGRDLTDNKTLIAAVAWGWALWRMRGGRSARISAAGAALVTLAIFLIPHSVWGSQIDWDRVGSMD